MDPYCLHRRITSSWLDGGLAMTVRSFDTSLKRTRSQTFTMVGKSRGLPVAAAGRCRIGAARECWPGHDNSGAAATGRDRRRAAASCRLPPAVAGQLPRLHRLPADRGGRARAGVRADRLLVLGGHAGGGRAGPAGAVRALGRGGGRRRRPAVAAAGVVADPVGLHRRAAGGGRARPGQPAVAAGAGRGPGGRVRGRLLDPGGDRAPGPADRAGAGGQHSVVHRLQRRHGPRPPAGRADPGRLVVRGRLRRRPGHLHLRPVRRPAPAAAPAGRGDRRPRAALGGRRAGLHRHPSGAAAVVRRRHRGHGPGHAAGPVPRDRGPPGRPRGRRLAVRGHRHRGGAGRALLGLDRPGPPPGGGPGRGRDRLGAGRGRGRAGPGPVADGGAAGRGRGGRPGLGRLPPDDPPDLCSRRDARAHAGGVHRGRGGRATARRPAGGDDRGRPGGDRVLGRGRAAGRRPGQPGPAGPGPSPLRRPRPPSRGRGGDDATVTRTVFRGARWPGDVAIEGGRIAAVGSVPAEDGDEVVRVDGDIVTAGLVNTHHHFYQWMTRGWAFDQTLFGWLTTLYPVWARLTPEDVEAAAAVALGELALTGCTTAADHHYLVPGGDDSVFDAIASAARRIGIRAHIARGSMDLGQSRGGLPPDSVVEDLDAILASTQAVYERLHDGDRIVVTVAPCSPFSVTPELMTSSAALARRLGLRLHTHLAETLDEERVCLERFGRRPVQVLDEMGWIASDVWVAHGVHFDDAEVRRLGETGTGVAHCPSSNCRLGSGIARVVDLTRAGVPVGLGVDGVASNEIGGLLPELRMALFLARQRDLSSTTFLPADALALATEGGARCLGRDDIGRLAPATRAAGPSGSPPAAPTPAWTPSRRPPTRSGWRWTPPTGWRRSRPTRGSANRAGDPRTGRARSRPGSAGSARRCASGWPPATPSTSSGSGTCS